MVLIIITMIMVSLMSGGGKASLKNYNNVMNCTDINAQLKNT